MIVQLSTPAALRCRSPNKIFLFGRLFHLDWVVFLARGDTLLAWYLLPFWSTSIVLLFCYFFLRWLIVTWFYVKISLLCIQGSVLCTSCLFNFFFNPVSEPFIKLSMSSSPALSISSNKAYICSLLAFLSISEYLFLALVTISHQKTVLLWFQNKIYLEKSHWIFWLFTCYTLNSAWKISK